MKSSVIILLVSLLLMGCASSVDVTRNYTVGSEMTARVGTSIAEWTIGSNWWADVPGNPSPMEIPPSRTPLGGRQLPMTKSLIFVGFDSEMKTVRVTYREFIDGLARPAFTQDLTFNTEDGLIVFEYFEANIVSVTSTSLTYIVTHEHSDLREN